MSPLRCSECSRVLVFYERGMCAACERAYLASNARAAALVGEPEDQTGLEDRRVGSKKNLAERDRLILLAAEAGEAHVAIASRFGIGPSRVSQIVKAKATKCPKCGCPKRGKC